MLLKNLTLRFILTGLLFYPILSAAEGPSPSSRSLNIAVTGICEDDSPHHNCWINTFFTCFGQQYGHHVIYAVVNFDNSWRLAADGSVDVVATGITPLPERNLPTIVFSNPYSLVKRGIRIHSANKEKFKTIEDFIGYKVAAVKGMTSHIDLKRRAPEGLQIVAPDSWEEVYALFEQNKVQGVAEGFYVFPNNLEINEYEDHTMMVDIHDLELGKVEGNTFVVNTNNPVLLQQLNEYIAKIGLPNNEPKRSFIHQCP